MTESLMPEMSAGGLIETVCAALDADLSRQAAGGGYYENLNLDDGWVTVDGAVDLKELAVAVVQALRLHHASTGGGVWGPQQFRWQTPWMPGAPSVDDLQALRD